ncbi:MAG TPA: phospholipase D-like domain-containing protein [Ktedonobacterales bacterium]
MAQADPSALPRTAITTHDVEAFFQSRRAGLDANLVTRLVDFIEATATSLDCAIYDLRHPRILAALKKVADGGKQVRIVYDGGKARSGGLAGDPKPSGTEEALRQAGLLDKATPVHRGSHLMHNKFLIRDGARLWTGSANFTVGGLEAQDNNCLILSDHAIIGHYQTEFTTLLNVDHQHALAHHQIPATNALTVPPLPATGLAAKAYFSPPQGEDVETTVASLIRTAKKVRVLAFLMSDPGILQGLDAFKDLAADIRGIYDPNGMQDVLRYRKGDQSAFWFMKDARFVSAPSHKFNPKGEQDFMHNKVMIFDDRVVVTGSYNFSENAELNDENLLVIDSAELAAAYTAYFEKLYATYGGKGLAAATPAVPPRRSWWPFRRG